MDFLDGVFGIDEGQRRAREAAQQAERDAGNRQFEADRRNRECEARDEYGLPEHKPDWYGSDRPGDHQHYPDDAYDRELH